MCVRCLCGGFVLAAFVCTGLGVGVLLLGFRVGLSAFPCDGFLVFFVGLDDTFPSVGALVGISSNSLPGSSTSATTKSNDSFLVRGKVNRY